MPSCCGVYTDKGQAVPGMGLRRKAWRGVAGPLRLTAEGGRHTASTLERGLQSPSMAMPRDMSCSLDVEWRNGLWVPTIHMFTHVLTPVLHMPAMSAFHKQHSRILCVANSSSTNKGFRGWQEVRPLSHNPECRRDPQAWHRLGTAGGGCAGPLCWTVLSFSPRWP